jgi:putative effector of murein hydrolase LrgA (UPF0299 family)
MMRWIRGIVGVLFVLVGLLWIGQGTGLIQGRSAMTGQMQWAIVGLIVGAIGVWLLWGALRASAKVSPHA